MGEKYTMAIGKMEFSNSNSNLMWYLPRIL